MNDLMKAAAQVIARAQDAVSEAGRSHKCDGAIIPDEEFQALVEALDDYEGLAKMDKDDAAQRMGEIR